MNEGLPITVPKRFLKCKSCEATKKCAQEAQDLAERASVTPSVIVIECSVIPASAQSEMTARARADVAGDGVFEDVAKYTECVDCVGLQAAQAANSEAPTADFLRL